MSRYYSCNLLLYFTDIYLLLEVKILDIVIKKGKEPILGKLRTIQLIKADLQLLMRIFMGSSNKDLIEKDHRISKSNFGPRKHYSIKIVILKKTII